MINLLPPEIKVELQAGLLNTLLRRFIIILFASLLLSWVIFGAGLTLTLQSKRSADTAKQQETAAAAQYNKTKIAAESYQRNLAAAKTILAGQISYTSLIIEITNTLPKGSILSSLNIDNTSFGKPFTLDAQTDTYDTALQLKKALADKLITVLPNKPTVHLMTNVSIVDTHESDISTTYKLSVTYSGVLTKQPPIINEQGSAL